ncbi:hypothetical protein F5883DRAFT_677971 [Diaporthe sp. PMI_573]|nr:hypothetical protein F5883DRAFT_677971 [Diaporthaceae sp. PMI_573]
MATQLSAGQVLCLNEDERALFVQQNLSDNTQDGSLNIQNITGCDELSEAERALLDRELLQAVKRVTAPSIDATALVAQLHQIPSELEHRTIQSYYPSHSRSSTALLDDGCLPLFYVGLLPQIEANLDAYAHLLQPWARQQHPADVKEAWHALSRQWNRLKEFRACGGTSRGAAEVDFEQTARLCWKREYDYEDGEDVERDVERHAERLSRWLVQPEFVLWRPFTLLADLKGQDQWTTYVEYLAFEAESLHGLAEAARRLEKRPKRHDVYKGKYQAAKAAAEQQQSRVGWVPSEIEKIEAEQKAATGESDGSTSGSSKKKGHTDDTNRPEDVFEPRLGKHRQTKKVEEVDKTYETEKMPAGKSASLSQTRRNGNSSRSTTGCAWRAAAIAATAGQWEGGDRFDRFKKRRGEKT